MTFVLASTSNRLPASPVPFSGKQALWTAALAFPIVVGPFWCLTLPSSSGFLGTLAGFVLLAVLVVSAVTDVRRHKIYNWATYSAFLWAILINITSTLLSSGEGTLTRAYHHATAYGPDVLGGVGLAQCLAGAALCFFITLFGYRMSGGGAGDVKLATAIGALLGVHHGIYAVAYSYIVAAVAILAWSAWTNGPLTLVKAGLRTVGAFFGPLWPFPPTASDATLLVRPIPLGPYFAIGTLLVVLEIVPS